MVERVPVLGCRLVSAPPLVLAHRGASRAAPENTVAAFNAARTLGADGVELDVRHTADGALVIHHDPEIPGFGLIVDAALADLRAAVPSVPTFAEALAACTGLLVNVEIKCLPWDPDADTPDHAHVRAVVDALSASPLELIVSSFDLSAIDACRIFAPELATAWLTADQAVVDAAARAHAHGHAAVNPDRKSALAASPSDIAAAHELGVTVNVWTVDEPADMLQLAQLGVDALITNVPDVARATLNAREQ
jgi:glycerophosphoryl diester phosphodiesterase